MTLQYTVAMAAMGLSLLSGAAQAAPITYDLISQQVGTDSGNGIITTSGTITTDGTLGVLSTNNITAFNIVLTRAGLGSLYLTNTSAAETIIGSYLTASSTGLSWNYAQGTGAEFSAVTNASPNTLAQFHLYTNRTDVDFGQIEHYTYSDGVQQVATVSTVPLPASAPLFGAALLGLAGLGYAAKRNKKVASAA